MRQPRQESKKLPSGNPGFYFRNTVDQSNIV